MAILDPNYEEAYVSIGNIFQEEDDEEKKQEFPNLYNTEYEFPPYSNNIIAIDEPNKEDYNVIY